MSHDDQAELAVIEAELKRARLQRDRFFAKLRQRAWRKAQLEKSHD